MVAGPRTPKRPYGHADLLVHRAAALGVIAVEDVEPFCQVRLGHRAVEPVAERLGVSVDCLRMRLNRASARLARALATGLLSGGPVPGAPQDLADGTDPAQGGYGGSREPATWTPLRRRGYPPFAAAA